MDNAMVKRGIGVVVLAIIAALLLGYLLKDKSRERQEVVDMKLPGAPEMTIPSLSETTTKVTDSAATLVNETKETVSNAGNAVVASTVSAASNTVEAVTKTATPTTQAVTNTVVKKTATNTNASDPGFSFRPPNKNEEQKINTSSSPKRATETTPTQAKTKNTVVASTKNTKTKETKKFKPTIEDEPKKKTVKTKKVVKKKPAPQKPIAKKPVKTKPSSAGYAIQLLATSSQTRADNLAKTMKSEGYSSFITQTKSNNKILYRVRVGGHKDRNAALTAQQSMKRRYQKNFFVQNSLVVSQ